MFTHPISENDMLIRVVFSQYSKKHFLKSFEKKYKGDRWSFTLDSIIEDIHRIRIKGYTLQYSQQVDELWHKDDIWVFKYDFAIAGTNVSPKSAGNRAVIFLDSYNNYAEILFIYQKTNLPKKAVNKNG